MTTNLGLDCRNNPNSSPSEPLRIVDDRVLQSKFEEVFREESMGTFGLIDPNQVFDLAVVRADESFLIRLKAALSLIREERSRLLEKLLHESSIFDDNIKELEKLIRLNKRNPS